MLAVKGIYDNGKVVFEKDMPVQAESTEVIVIFPNDEVEESSERLSLEKKRKLIEEFSGSVNRMIDIKAERLEALGGKYESAD